MQIGCTIDTNLTTCEDEHIRGSQPAWRSTLPTIDERLDAIARNLELVSQMQLRTEQVVNLLAEDQAKTERVMLRIASLVRDHEQRPQNLE
jgi:hypothetical protein